MLPGTHNGEWFLPNGKTYPGQLIINKKKQTIQLHIVGKEFIEGTEVNNRDSHPQHFHSAIVGNCGTKITLHNCFWVGCLQLANDLYGVIYDIEYVFTGVHFSDPALLIRGGTFIFPNLSTWYDGSTFFDKLEGKEGLFVDGEHVVQNVLGTDEIKISEDLTLVLYDEVNKHIDKMNVSYRIVYEKYIRFQYAENTSFKSLLDDAVILLKLMAFCFGKPLNCFIAFVHVDKKYLDTDITDALTEAQYRLVHVNNYSHKKKQKITNDSSHSRHMLLSKWTCSQEEMNDVIINWFNNKSLYNIYEYYLDSNNWLQGTKAKLSNMMFNNRFLNLIQGLEDYYRENFETSRTAEDRKQFDLKKSAVLKQVTEPQLKKWLNDTFNFSKYPKLEEKLSAILLDLSDELSKVFKGISVHDFPKLSAQFRNNLSHGMSKEINQGPTLHTLYFMAQIVLGTCILKSLGVNNIKERIAYYSKFEDAAYQIYFTQTKKSKEE